MTSLRLPTREIETDSKAKFAISQLTHILCAWKKQIFWRWMAPSTVWLWKKSCIRSYSKSCYFAQNVNYSMKSLKKEKSLSRILKFLGRNLSLALVSNIFRPFSGVFVKPKHKMSMICCSRNFQFGAERVRDKLKLFRKITWAAQAQRHLELFFFQLVVWFMKFAQIWLRK